MTHIMFKNHGDNDDNVEIVIGYDDVDAEDKDRD